MEKVDDNYGIFHNADGDNNDFVKDDEWVNDYCFTSLLAIFLQYPCGDAVAAFTNCTIWELNQDLQNEGWMF